MGLLAALLAVLIILPILISILSRGSGNPAEIDKLKEEAAQLVRNSTSWSVK